MVPFGELNCLSFPTFPKTRVRMWSDYDDAALRPNGADFRKEWHDAGVIRIMHLIPDCADMARRPETVLYCLKTTSDQRAPTRLAVSFRKTPNAGCLGVSFAFDAASELRRLSYTDTCGQPLLSIAAVKHAQGRTAAMTSPKTPFAPFVLLAESCQSPYDHQLPLRPRTISPECKLLLMHPVSSYSTRFEAVRFSFLICGQYLSDGLRA